MADQLPAGAPPSDDPPPGNPDPAAPPPAETNERPEWLPENLWDPEAGFRADEFGKYRPPAADVPSDPTAYELPTHDKFDINLVKDSPFFATLRQSAFEQGIGQEGFTKIVTDWIEGEVSAGEAYYTEQRAAIGTNVEQREQAISAWLGSNLPEDEAEALRGIATNAKAFHALERLMNKGGAAPPVPPPPAVTRKSEQEIRALMNSKAYMGKTGERNPAVVKEVDDWFEEQARLDAQPKP
jgi:hypothetical protein